MSWDIFVQDIPAAAQSVDDIPNDFRPAPIGSRSSVIAAILEVVPEVDFSDPSWGVIEGDGFSIEVNLGDEEELSSFAFHVRGGGASVPAVAAVLDRLGLRAFDPQSETGIFSANTAGDSFRSWREYRDAVLRKEEA